MKNKNPRAIKRAIRKIDERIEILTECLKTWQGIRKRPRAMKMLKKKKDFYDNLIVDCKARIAELKALKKELKRKS